MVSGSATTIVNIVVMVIGFPIYLHFLGYEKYGVWLVLSTVLTFASLGNLGIGTAVMKLVAEEYGRGNTSGVQRYIATAIALLFLSGMMVLAVILIFRNPIVAAFKLDAENRQMVFWLLPYIGVLCIYSFIVQIFEAALSGLGRMDLANYIRTLSNVIQVATSGILLAFGSSVKSMLIGSFVSCIIIHVLTIICMRRIIHLRIWDIGNINRVYLKSLFQFGGTIFSGSLISMLFNPFNKLMLSRYAGVATLPIYEIAFTGSMHVRSLAEAGLRALVPKISYLSANLNKKGSKKILALYRRSMKLILVFGAPFYGVLLMLSPFLLKIWLDGKFDEALPGAFQLMLFGTYLSLLGVPAYYFLMGTGKVLACVLSMAIAATVNIVMVITIIFITHTLTIRNIVLIVVLGCGFSTLYLIRQWRINMSDYTKIDKCSNGFT